MSDAKQHFDFAIIGSGPGGYVAAIRAAQHGKTVALIEKGALGGTCLNVGCIPTKALLSGAGIWHQIQKAADFGISISGATFDYGAMKQRKDGVVSKIQRNLEGLLQANKIQIIKGSAEFVSPKELKIKGDKLSLIEASTIIIATGSMPMPIPSLPCDHVKIFDSTSILDLDKFPKSIVIVGGGYIGCEFASLFAELGSKVTIVEALSSIVITQGKAVSDALTSAFQKKGIEIKTQAKVKSLEATSSGVRASLESGESIEAEIALISIGRKIVTEGLQLEKAGVATDNRGAIIVNERMETNVPGVFAIGDVNGKMMLAHVASHQGVIAVDAALGRNVAMHYHAIPAVIFTHPEISSVGMTEEDARAKGIPFTVGKFPFLAIGKAVAAGDPDGFAQILIHPETGQILGAQVVGHEASNIISEVALAISAEVDIDTLVETVHAHPTLAEVILEAGFLAKGTPIHLPPKAKK